MSNYHTPGSNGRSSNSSSFLSRREMRDSHTTGALPALGSVPEAGRIPTGSFEFEHLIQSLHELFELDRQVASQPDSTRCGICYLYFPVTELHYREEGFYACPSCDYALGNQHVPMLRKQQKM